MTYDQKIGARLDELITMGQQVLNKRTQGPLMENFVDSQSATRWSTSVRSILGRSFGDDSEHYLMFVKITNEYLSAAAVERAMGVLQAALDDLRGGHLYNLRQVVEAEIFDDFLEQSEHLQGAGYYQAAAVIAGSVLEDGLRTLIQRHNLQIADKPKLDQMNNDLAKAGIYNKLTQKQITAFADLRNKAAHGLWDQFQKDDVADMLRGVRRFMAEYCA